ncbi:MULTISPECIES: GTPase domain-containing protein [unclassified Legionella]|uniref:GTPase domain-containing protein n=1 Tax=unclassified Legionella TaxID=2622702 RepID=UPI0010569D33|nr:MULTISPECIES: GTPase domain-containing protein [unclassified Legionella]MDI9817589.1 GTPase domain-containing protein [Legionella sp. PL877]
MPTNILLLGNQNAGKSKLATQLKNHLLGKVLKKEPENTYDENYRHTIGTDYHKIPEEVKLEDVFFGIWDSGERNVYDLTMTITSSINIVVLYCVDLASGINQQKITDDIKELQEKINKPSIMLVGTKADKLEDKKDIDALNSIEGEFTSRFLTSSKNNIGITELANYLWTNFHPQNSKKSDNLKNKKKSDDNKPNLGKGSNACAWKNKIPPTSPLYSSAEALFKTIPQEKHKEVEQKVIQLIDKLKKPETDREKAIHDFTKDCQVILEGKHPNATQAVFVFAAAAAITAVVAIIGFGIGFALGIWSGPGAFLSGIAAGSTAAVMVASASGLSGLATNFLFFKMPSEMKAVNQFAAALNAGKQETDEPETHSLV